MENIKVDEAWKNENGMYVCPICNKIYSKKGITTHIYRSHTDKKFSSGYNGHYNDDDYKKKISDATTKDRDDFEVRCFKCGKHFTVNEIISNFPSKERYFCNRSCANSKEVTIDQRRHLSEMLTGRVIKDKTLIWYITCKNCGKTFVSNKKARVYCDNKCKISYYQKNKTEKQLYYKQCQFRFSLSDYPDEFDFLLIDQFGWYKAPNRGNNPDGISRDHMISRSYGWIYNIDPEIISHPANCQLMCQSGNWDKRDKCSISLEELKDRILKWGLKHSS